MPKPKGPTIADVAAQVAATLDEPIAYDEFAQRILAIRPSAAKNPISQVKSSLRYELGRIGLTFADSAKTQITPIRRVLTGLTVRHIFDAEEVSARRMFLSDSEAIFLPGSLSALRRDMRINLRLVDANGAEVKTKFDLVPEEREGIFGRFTYERPALHMPRWLAQHSVKAGDSALLTILDYDAARWQIVYEPAAQRRAAEIEAANRALADLLFEQLDNARDERVSLDETLMAAFAQLAPAQRAYPGDPWMQVIERDGRMRYDGYQITYAEKRSPLESMLADLQEEFEPAPAPSKSLTPAQESTVYRFKIHATRNKKRWRRIEILGGQTLRDLNSFLVEEFKHDWDHMGGFWRLVPRGAGKRVREVEIARISPFADNEDRGANLRMAELDLEPGSQLRWVFDFGDWHQYDLVIEDVEDAPAQGVEYPRVVTQNKPHYLYCAACQEQGRQTIATHVCRECSSRREQPVAFCDDCVAEHDEEHYTEDRLLSRRYNL